jgi:hypothetical protein
MCDTIDRVAGVVGLGPNPEQKKGEAFTNEQARMAGQEAGFSGDLRRFYTGEVLPKYKQSLDELYSPAYEQEQANLGKGDYGSGLSAAGQQRRNEGTAMGLRPEDLAMSSRGDLARQAEGYAGAENTARMGVRAQRLGALGPGMGMPSSVMGGYNTAAGGYGAAAGAYYDIGNTMTQNLKGALQTAGKAAGQYATGGAGGGGAPGMSRGGVVRGPGGPHSDSVHMRASPGEVVIPADVAQHMGYRHLAKMVQKAREEMMGMNAPGPRRFMAGPAAGAPGQAAPGPALSARGGPPIPGQFPQISGPRRMAA